MEERTEVSCVATRSRAVIVITTQPAAFESTFDQIGYEVVGVSDTSVNGERLAEFHHPEIILVEQAIVGEQGWDALPHLRAASPESRIILVVADEWKPEDTGPVGGLAVATIAELQERAASPDSFHAWVVAETTPKFVERRKNPDRRNRQDWSAVGFEKRDRPDRRKSPG